MADKEKNKAAPQQSKNIPKDGQVIMSIMKEMGITEYEPKTIIQLTEFVYRYATSVLEEARTYANNSKKKFIDLEDVRLALQLSSESSFTTPPAREVLLECSRNRNNTSLPIVKPHCGLRLPADRHCLSGCNYVLKSLAPKPKNKGNFLVGAGTPGIKITTKPAVSYIKRTNPIGVTKQTVTIPKVVNQNQTILKPKIQISQNIQAATSSNIMDVDLFSLKRKREDDDM